MKMGIIYNPFAGGNKKRPDKRRQNLEKILGGRGILHETRSIEELHAALQEFQRENIDVLALSGGDGSNHFALTALQQVYCDRKFPWIALLRGGTMNLLETSLKMRGKPEARLKKAIRMMDSGRFSLVSHTMLCVNGKYGYIFGNGVVANFLKEYYQNGNPSLFNAISLFARAVWAGITGRPLVRRIFSPIRAHVHVEQSILPETSFSTLMAATERECGLGFKPFYRAREKAGAFHFLAATKLHPLEVIQNLPNFYKGKKAATSSIYEFVTDRVLVETFEPYYYTIDGEMLNSTKRLEISAGPVIQILAI